MTRPSEKNLVRIILLVFILASLYRLYPLALGPISLRETFMTEDGYLMLTIARNIAIGLGMSVSDGTIASNGVQPLATFIFVVPFYLTGGDKILGLAWVQLILAVVAIIGFFAVQRFMRLMLAPQDDNPLWPWLLATIWFVSPTVLLHTMNGLETGLYSLMLVVTLVVFAKVLLQPDVRSLRLPLLLGFVGGVTFLARNDAVFMLFSIYGVWFWHAIFIARQRLSSALRLIIPSGIVVIVISSPWMIHNYVNFGSIVPVSGTAQALSGGLGVNAQLLPAILFEYIFPMLLVPEAIHTVPLFQLVACGIILIIAIVFVVQTWRRGGVARYLMLSYLIYALVMIVYYGFFFGAGWFLSRYLSPLAPFLLLATFSVAYDFVRHWMKTRSANVIRGIGVVCIMLCLVFLGRYLLPGVKEQGHFQVVDWVAGNVVEDEWVGAVQTGTVGFWHDRTINLDGKVNPDALEALLSKGHVLDYVVESEITYIADWAGVALWVTDEMAPLNTNFVKDFELVVDEPERNLAVLSRR